MSGACVHGCRGAECEVSSVKQRAKGRGSNGGQDVEKGREMRLSECSCRCW